MAARPAPEFRGALTTSPAPTAAMLAEALDSLGEMVALFDRDERFLFANAAWYRGHYPDGDLPAPGISARDMNMQLLREGFFKIPAGMTAETFSDGAVAAMRAFGSGFRLDTADGRHFLAAARPTADQGYLVKLEDVTEQVRVERLLTDTIAQLPIGLAISDADGRLAVCNAAYADFCGLPVESLRAMTFDERARAILPRLAEIDGAPCDDHDRTLALLSRATQNPVSARLVDGRRVQIEWQRSDLGERVATITDVTASAERETFRQAATQDAIQALTDGIALFDADFRFVLANERYFTMWYPPHLKRPEAGERFVDILDRVLDDGQMLVPEGYARDEFRDLMEPAIRAHGTDFRLSTPRGTLSVSSFESPMGGFLLEFTDITERLKIEDELTRQREIAHQSEKLSALGELLAGVAHELNNPLSVVFGYAQMLRGRVSDPDLAEWVDFLAQAAERSARIVRVFLAMARQRPMRMDDCEVNAIVETALDIAGSGLRASGAAVTLDLGADLPRVSGDPDQLTQVLSNLIVNGAQAIRDKGSAGRLEIATAAQGDTLTIRVRDNGPGIPEDLRPRIFEPFFTTKEVGVGTGVGLALAHRLIESHGGAIRAEPAQGQGASFVITLPVATASSATEEDAAAPEPPRPLRVLVLDDEAQVARLLKDMLSAAGHDVTICTEPRSALRLIADTRFDAILSDVRMPDMDGGLFLKAARSVSPRAARRIGFVTGDALGPDVIRLLADSGRPHIEKPIDPAELTALVAELAVQETAP